MSVYVFLNEKAAVLINRNLPGKNSVGVFKGMPVMRQDGRFYLALTDEDSKVPSELLPFVDEISFRGVIECLRWREQGVYRHRTAIADVERGVFVYKCLLEGDYATYPHKVRILAKTMDDIRDIIRMFKIGSIKPGENHDVVQKVETSPEDKKLLASLEAENKRLRTELELSKKAIEARPKDAEKKVVQLENFADQLAEECQDGWPFCTKTWVLGEINKIIDGETES